MSRPFLYFLVHFLFLTVCSICVRKKNNHKQKRKNFAAVKYLKDGILLVGGEDGTKKNKFISKVTLYNTTTDKYSHFTDMPRDYEEVWGNGFAPTGVLQIGT